MTQEQERSLQIASMEKPASNKSKNRILKLIPKAAAQAAVTFHNLPFSPRRRDRSDLNATRLKNHHNKGFSGPLIPEEARRKLGSLENQEPTSPKVSCMGQVKRRNKICKKKQVSLPKGFGPEAPEKKNKKKASGIRKIFGGGGRKLGRSAESTPVHEAATSAAAAAPSLVGMRKFASSRDTFANFDWTAAAQIAPEDNRPEYYSDEEEEREYGGGDDEVIIPFSAPIVMGGGGRGGGGGFSGVDLEAKKEINLWKRRTMAQPKQLRLNVDGGN